jgi:hypothetical protein
MPSFKLDYYSFRIKKKNKKEYVDIQSSLNNISFTNFFKKFASLFETDMEVDEIFKRTFQFQPNSLTFSKNDRFISGTIQAGEFGFGRNITNTITRKIKSKLLKTDSVTNPFYFFLYFPKDSVVGYLCLERIGAQGIMTIFSDYFRKFFKDNTDDFILEFSPIVNKELLLKLIADSTISEITLRRYDLPTGMSSKFKIGEVQPEKPMTAEFTLRSPGGFSNLLKTKVNSYIDNPQTIFFDFPALIETGFDENTETSIKFNNGKSDRTIILNHLERFKSNFLINNNVIFDEDGFPTFTSIEKIAKEIFSENFVLIKE